MHLKQSKKKSSFNWVNLLLWTLVLISFIIAIIAVSKKSPAPVVKMDDGTTTDDLINSCQNGVMDILKNKGAQISSISGVETINFSDGSKYVGKNMTGVENMTGLQSLEFQNKMKLKQRDSHTLDIDVKDVPDKRNPQVDNLVSFHSNGGDLFTVQAKDGHYFFVNPGVFGSHSLDFKKDIS